jgi:hypothetical protein
MPQPLVRFRPQWTDLASHPAALVPIGRVSTDPSTFFCASFGPLIATDTCLIGVRSTFILLLALLALLCIYLFSFLLTFSPIHRLTSTRGWQNAGIKINSPHSCLSGLVPHLVCPKLKFYHTIFIGTERVQIRLRIIKLTWQSSDCTIVLTSRGDNNTYLQHKLASLQSNKTSLMQIHLMIQLHELFFVLTETNLGVPVVRLV